MGTGIRVAASENQSAILKTADWSGGTELECSKLAMSYNRSRALLKTYSLGLG